MVTAIGIESLQPRKLIAPVWHTVMVLQAKGRRIWVCRNVGQHDCGGKFNDNAPGPSLRERRPFLHHSL